MIGDRRSDTRTSFIDMLLSGQMNLFVIFVLTLLMIAPQQKKIENLNAKSDAKVVISMEWPSSVDCDLDLWVRGPTGAIVWWKNRDLDGMHLERDDTGMINDVVVVGDQTFTRSENSENWVLREVIPGEYTVNVHFFRAKAEDKCSNVPVTLDVVMVNPTFNKIYTKQLVMAKQGDEEHAFRFTVDSYGQVIKFDYAPTSLVAKFIIPNVSTPGQAIPPTTPGN